MALNHRLNCKRIVDERADDRSLDSMEADGTTLMGSSSSRQEASEDGNYQLAESFDPCILITSRRNQVDKEDEPTISLIRLASRRRQRQGLQMHLFPVMLLLLMTTSCCSYSNSAPSRLPLSMFLEQHHVNNILVKPPPVVASTLAPSEKRNDIKSSNNNNLQRRLHRGRLGIYFATKTSEATQDYAKHLQPQQRPLMAAARLEQQLILLDESTASTTTTLHRTSRNNTTSIPSSKPIRKLAMSPFAAAAAAADQAEQIVPWQQRQQRNKPSRKQHGRHDAHSDDSALSKKRAFIRDRIERRNLKRELDEAESAAAMSEAPNSLAEWSRTVNLEPLLQRRRTIQHEKLHGKSTQLKGLTETQNVGDMGSPHSSTIHPTRINDLYYMARKADKRGDVKLTKRILYQLLKLTPKDARLYRRLARLEADQGNVSMARKILQKGLYLQPKDPYLLHGMATLATGTETAKDYYQQSIACDPSIPHAHHALGVLLHSQGQIASAMRVLNVGLQKVPPRAAHRLHHALGDVYRDAKLWDMAATCYHRAIQLSPHESSLGFAYTNLAFVKYEQGGTEECRQWLVKAVSSYNGRNANAWQALAQFEETEGNIDKARAVCISALATYERFLLTSLKRHKIPMDKTTFAAVTNDTVQLKNEFLKRVPVYRSGDRFFNVYRTWLRLEACHGSLEAVEEIYERAKFAFPRDYKFTLDVARYYLHQGLLDRAPKLLEEACRIGKGHADPHRLLAEYEMKQGNYLSARRIFYEGAIKVMTTCDGRSPSNLAQLFHSWGICEWHLDNVERAETMLDHALRLTENCLEGAMLRSVILYTFARLEHSRGEPLLAQHCIGLCLKENAIPGGALKVWKLWSDVAASMDNDRLSQLCSKQAEKVAQDTQIGQLSQTAGVRRPHVPPHDMANMLRREPWHDKIFYSPLESVLFQSPQLPEQ
ncbi:hypothetical protein MPSEU_000016500 [Mayamaea pseudoterrestris]|nr:hypothetical protein MPSEU_000016500 [Mayamaea pseudoterrestris]